MTNQSKERNMQAQTAVRLNFDDKEGWRALVPEPFWTTKTVPIWKRFNERNWRPQCTHCMEVFKTRRAYDEHYLIYVAKWPSNFVEAGWQQFVLRGTSENN